MLSVRSFQGSLEPSMFQISTKQNKALLSKTSEPTALQKKVKVKIVSVAVQETAGTHFLLQHRPSTMKRSKLGLQKICYFHIIYQTAFFKHFNL